MRVTGPRRIVASRGRVLLFSLCFGDRRSFGHPLLMLYTAYARVRALRVKRCAEDKQRNRDRRQNFQRICFHICKLGFVIGKSDGCPPRQIQKSFEQLRGDPTCLFHFA